MRQPILHCLLCFVVASALPEGNAWAEPMLDINPSSPLTFPAGTPWYEGNYTNDGDVIGPDTQLPFRLFAPDGYDFSVPNGAEHPLIIFLHGAGSRNSNSIQHILNLASLRYWAEDAVQTLSPTGGAFVLAPKITSFSDRWTDQPPGPGGVNPEFNSSGYSADSVPVADNMELALELIAGIVAGGDNVDFDFTTRIDPSRIYIVGTSMGGFGAWDALGRVIEFPTLLPAQYNSYRFAAGITSSGAGPTDRGQAMADVPIWALRHDDDLVVPSAGTDNMIAAIEAVNGDLFFETDPVIDGETFSTKLNTILGEKRLLTRFQGQQPLSSSSPHSWAATEWYNLNDQNDYPAQWLFAQQTVPEPTSFALLLLGIIAVAIGHRNIRR